MKKKQHLIPAIILFGSMVLSSPCFGFSQEDIAMHGFVSQGYLRSTNNNYFSNTEDGTFEFNEIAVNFSAPITDELSFGVQFFSRDFGTLGNNELFVDWAFLDYNLYDWLGFRAGKIKLPFGLHNLKRDADMLRTAIILPQSVYSEGLRDFVIALYGISLYGTKDAGTLGYFDYEIYLGTLHMKSDTPYFQQSLAQLQYTLPDVAGIISMISLEDIAIKHTEGGVLTWNTPIAGLKLNATFLYADCESNATLSGTTPLIMEVTVNGFNTQSIEYDSGGLTFTVEAHQMDMKTELFSQKSGYKADGWYGSASWEALPSLSLGITYGEYYPNNKDRDGKDYKAVDLPDFYAWQKDVTLSVRYNINEYWCIKLENHWINGLGLAGIVSNPPETADENWLLYAIKTSLNF